MNMKKMLACTLTLMVLWTAFSWTRSAEGDEYDRGKNLYENNCQICHGPHGKGDGPASASFNPRPANFTDPQFWQHKNVNQFITGTIEKGHGLMPPIALKPDEIKAVIDYIAHTFVPGK